VVVTAALPGSLFAAASAGEGALRRNRKTALNPPPTVWPIGKTGVMPRVSGTVLGSVAASAGAPGIGSVSIDARNAGEGNAAGVSR
jgi:hypothetical protein